jgi:ubiquinone/menaquinone biosynthesis C-methylase UbiE
MASRAVMDLWQRRGRTFGERSALLQRAEAIQGIMEESLLFLQCVEGIVLDVGCGDGIPTISLVQHHQVIGVDFASTMLLRAKSNLPSMGFLRASIDHLPLRSASISAVACFFVLSDYSNPTDIMNELQRVLQAHGKIVLGDYSSDDDLNNLMDELQVKILGKGRDMFRLSPEAMSILAQRLSLKTKNVRKLSHQLTIPLDIFIHQLYLSSVGAEYREKQLSEDQWRKFLGGCVKGSEVSLTRRFVLVLGEA